MEQVERIGVSLEQGLLRRFDELIGGRGYQSRSEAIRDLIRKELSAERLENPKAQTVAVVHMVYDHHSTKLMEKLTGLQHGHVLKTICTTHIHLDAHDCLEVIVLKGAVGEIRRVAEQMLSQKGVKVGEVSFVAAG
jgi:CopG family nickel-responsive transcriptional regulator